MSLNKRVYISKKTYNESEKFSDVFKTFKKLLKENDLEEKIELKFVNDLGIKSNASSIAIFPESVYYTNILVKDIENIVNSHLVNDTYVDDLMYYSDVLYPPEIDEDKNIKIIEKREIDKIKFITPNGDNVFDVDLTNKIYIPSNIKEIAEKQYDCECDFDPENSKTLILYKRHNDDEYCERCTPCREGMKRIRELLNKIGENKAHLRDFEILERLSHNMANSSLCIVGQQGPHGIILFLDYLRESFQNQDSHKTIKLVKFNRKQKIYEITDTCIGCTKCKRNCPVDCITGNVKEKHLIDQKTCVMCGNCKDICPVNAITCEEF